MNTESLRRHGNTLETLRRFLLVVILLALLGTGAELLLAKHYEDVWQWAPLVLIALALLVLGWLGIARGAAAVRVWQGLMVLFLISGFVGLALHWQAKMEFKQEANASLTGLNLFWESMKSLSPPTLAPGIMIQIGLLGLAYAYRRPARGSGAKISSDDTGEN